MEESKELNIFYFISKHITGKENKNLITENDNDLKTYGKIWNLFELIKKDNFIVYGSGYDDSLTLWQSVSGSADKVEFEENVKNLFEIINKIIKMNNNKRINLYLGIHDKHLVGFLRGGGQEKLNTEIKNGKLIVGNCIEENISTTIQISNNINKIELYVFQHHKKGTPIEGVIKKIKIVENDKVSQKDLKTVFVTDYKKEIKEELKKTNKLIRDLLPLAIDIQGLSEVSKDKAQDYFKEIKNGGYLEGIKKRVNKKIVALNEILEKNKKIKKDKKKYINDLIDEFNAEDYISKLKGKYLTPENDLFFPQWLSNFSEELNERM